MASIAAAVPVELKPDASWLAEDNIQVRLHRFFSLKGGWRGYDRERLRRPGSGPVLIFELTGDFDRAE